MSTQQTYEQQIQNVTDNIYVMILFKIMLKRFLNNIYRIPFGIISMAYINITLVYFFTTLWSMKLVNNTALYLLPKFTPLVISIIISTTVSILNNSEIRKIKHLRIAEDIVVNLELGLYDGTSDMIAKNHADLSVVLETIFIVFFNTLVFLMSLVIFLN